MANPTYGISDIPNLKKQITDLNSEAGNYEGLLNSSPTALGGMGTPTSDDISNQETLQRIQGEVQKLTDAKLRAQWYPPASQNSNVVTTGGGEVSSGRIGKVLDTIARPLYGIVGATKHAIGQGSGSLYQDVADNMVRNKNTFSDVLKTSGVTGGVAAPLGFALDIALDPVNWATMGTSAIVPRLGKGLYKGMQSGNLLEGVATAAKSSMLEKATTVGRFIPKFRKSDSFQSLGERAMKATSEWEKFSGIDPMDLMAQKGMGIGTYRITLGEVINKVADVTPGGRAALDVLWYSPKDWIRQAQIKDVLQTLLVPNVDMADAFRASRAGEDMAKYARPLKEQTAEAVQATSDLAGVGPSTTPIDFGADLKLMTPQEIDTGLAKMTSAGVDINTLSQSAPQVVNQVDDVYTALLKPEMVISADPIENAVRVSSELVNGPPVTYAEIEKIVNSGALNDTGVKWFDNMMSSVKSFEKKIGSNKNNIVLSGKKTMAVYDASMSIFRVAKIGLSPTAYTNAVVGNLIMTHMTNGDLGPGFLKTLKLSFDFFRDKPGAVDAVEKMLFKTTNGVRDPEMVRFFNEFKTAARGTFGLDLMDQKTYVRRVMQNGRDAGLINGKEAIDTEGKVKEAVETLNAAMKKDPEKAGLTIAREVFENGGSNIDKGTGMLANEMSVEVMTFVADKVKANPDHMGWKMLDFTLNKAPSQYEKIDQIYKLTTFLRATQHGYTVPQLRQMRHVVDISPEDLTKYSSKEEGQFLYRMSPRSALELAGAMYLNYNAMPAAIRVMRNFPLLGSPFISFMYGMSLKTGQTLAYNPASFNKVTFAMNDFGGSKTPLEKKALDDPQGFYSYLKQPGMFRMPFFDENPLYLNLASAIPYYSLNMFSPSQTEYGDSFREQIAGGVQRSPLLKDPVGSMLYDYMILPLILGEGIAPQGQFGQPLYPVDAGVGTKAAYGARSLAEAYVPNVAAFAGLVTPESVAEYIPSYRWRQLARAKEGKNQLGISGKEPASSRTIRNVLNASGIPLQSPVNTNFSGSKGQ